MNIVFLDGYTVNPGDLTWEAFERLGTFRSYDRTPPELVVERAREADVLIVNKTLLGDGEFAQLPRLRLVMLAAAGYDTVDVAAARRRGIPVCNAAGYGNASVAQSVVAHLLNITNRVGEYARRNREGFWSGSPDFCACESGLTELTGKRVAIVGFGNIGQAVARLLRPFGVELFAVTSKAPEALPADVGKLSLEEAFRTCDVVSLNCALSPQNEGFINARVLGQGRLKPGLILINTARGRLVCEADIAEALRDGRLGAYGTDVLAQEPPPADNPLLSAPRCYVTPHNAWATREARMRILDILEANLRGFLSGTPINVVN
ncbi:MAG: D-2-hydroxyacid dehydrogenase [Alloprevotella sp.]|nr:D-2-hydroxyacid dehydrogenase [Alloprevotella sp.]